jgi:hypothetical protein
MWDADMGAVLIDAAFSGIGLRRIEDVLGVCRPAMARRRNELGLPPTPALGRPVGVIEWHERERRGPGLRWAA